MDFSAKKSGPKVANFKNKMFYICPVFSNKDYRI